MDLLTACGLSALTDDPGFTLWYRPTTGRKAAWEPVAHADTERQCLDHIGIGNRRHGSWLILRTGLDPDGGGKQ